MPHLSCPRLLLLVALVLLLPQPAPAKPLPLKDLKRHHLVERMRDALKNKDLTPARIRELALIQESLDLDPKEIHYADGEIAWTCWMVKPLNANRMDDMQKEVRDLLHYCLSKN